ncbi:MAG: hypothetical protein ABIJ34_00635 [archaeon]
MRKAQSISINTVIVAAIALIVLIVVIAIFGGRTRIFANNVRDCTTQGSGAHCDSACETFEVNIPGTNCEDITSTKFCCVELFKPKTE